MGDRCSGTWVTPQGYFKDFFFERSQWMPWKVRTMVEARRELVELALKEEVSVTELSARFGVSRKTAYKWLKRFAKEGVEGMKDRSRRPEHTPGRTSCEVEAQVISMREAHPAW